MLNLCPPDDFELITVINPCDTHILTSRGEINKEHFETWLRNNDKMNWEQNASDERGEHVQRSGENNPDEYYYHTNNIVLLCDLWEYIIRLRFSKLINLTEQAKKLKSLL